MDPRVENKIGELLKRNMGNSSSKGDRILQINDADAYKQYNNDYLSKVHQLIRYGLPYFCRNYSGNDQAQSMKHLAKYAKA